MTSDGERLKLRFHRWQVQRQWNYHRENHGHFPDWGASDDEAVDLLRDLADEFL